MTLVYVRPRFAGYAVGKAEEDVVWEVELLLRELETELKGLDVVLVVKLLELEVVGNVEAIELVVDSDEGENPGDDKVCTDVPCDVVVLVVEDEVGTMVD